MGLAGPLSTVASRVCVAGGEGGTSGGMEGFGGETGTREVRRVSCWRPSWGLMEVVKGYDAEEMKRTVPWNHQSFGGGSNGAGRRPRDGHGRPGGRETGLASLLFRPWYVWVMNEKFTEDQLSMHFRSNNVGLHTLSTCNALRHRSPRSPRAT
jgi:hypothetical protein